MAVNFDRWTLLKLFEVALAITCLVFKRVTDDEAYRLFFYLQRLSREWSLLNNVTWDRIGSAVADATYGGYIIITAALFIGRLTEELPTQKRITEFVLLGVGALLFIILGSLEFAALDSVPSDLVDNAAVLGTLSLVTAALFLLDMGGPKARKTSSAPLIVHSTQTTPPRSVTKTQELRTITEQVYDIEKEIESNEMKLDRTPKQTRITTPPATLHHHLESNGLKSDSNGRYKDSSFRYAREKKPTAKSFGIYGKDAHQHHISDNESDDELPPKMIEEQSPVWSKIRKGQYGKLDVHSPTYHSFSSSKRGGSGTPEPDSLRPPSGPGDPGYVQYTAQHWGEPGQKTPRHSPTQV